MSAPRGRRGVTALEALLALGLTLLVLTLLGGALRLVLKGAGSAEWRAGAERRLESFAHVLEEELRRANHLITAEPGGERLHDPRFSAAWVGEGGATLAFRVFRPDQEVEDPAELDLEALEQDRVFFLGREGRVVLVRRGDLEPPETRVLLEDVLEVNFSPGSSYESMGPLGGLLRVRVRLRRPGGPERLERELGIHTGVPVVEVGAAPEGEDLLPPPQPADSPYNR